MTNQKCNILNIEYIAKGELLYELTRWLYNNTYNFISQRPFMKTHKPTKPITDLIFEQALC